ncbi:type IV toxin-antitoxin system AbiEi family antitoxin [Actinoplanes rectilineatus]|uniref:type IV toxin-antitoxin system AbiEi family antitoxin n=1 Tax=Actinoplanes rectilineatus TaxID=113571 RepID=UPI0005F2EE58|nr:type IV toxin-antitoxin system AbiEi family antitoxin [Actinoplanes rectilineatus]
MDPATEPPRNETEVLRRASAILTERLPATWSLQTTTSGSGPDLLLTVTAPDGNAVTLVIEARTTVEGRDVTHVAAQLDAHAGSMSRAHGVLAARYLSPQVRRRLIENGISFVDTTGNLRLETASPGLFIADRGADGDPWRGPGRPRGTLKGAPAARVVRAITDFARDWSIRDLIQTAQVSTGSVYRVVDFLEREGLAERTGQGKVVIPRWDAVLRRWSEDYGFTRSGRVTRWIAPRGLDDLLARVAENSVETYAMSGTIAAAEWASYAPARAAMIHTADAGTAAARWGLRPADAGANVMLAEPDTDVPFLRSLTSTSRLRIAAPAQVTADLMTGPGRNPQEAEQLLDWMTANERSWRI